MVFTSTANGNQDLYVSERETLTSPWSPPIWLGPTVNSPQTEVQPTLSPDGTILYFGSARAGSMSPLLDIWMTTREKRGRH